MQIAFVTDVGESYVLEIDPNMEMENIMILLEAECGIPVAQQNISYEGRELVDPKKTIAQCGVRENGMILLRRRVVVAGRTAEQDAEMMRLQVLGDPQLMNQLREARPELVRVATNDLTRFADLLHQLHGTQEEAETLKRQETTLINADPYDMQAQRRIEETIRQEAEAVMESLDRALEYSPESFGRVHTPDNARTDHSEEDSTPSTSTSQPQPPIPAQLTDLGNPLGIISSQTSSSRAAPANSGSGSAGRGTPNTAADAFPIAPYPPSPLESKYFYYGLPSRPRLVARSSSNIWVEPTGPEAYFVPKELSTIGSHPLQAIWEATVGPALVKYLDSKGVKWTSLDPVRIGWSGEASPPVIMWMGVAPDSLSAKEGIEVATHCRGILSAHSLNIHVEIRESMVIHSAGPPMYKPVPTSNATAGVREPFSTALGLPICAEATPYIEGTGGFFISNPLKPGKIYLVTARHVVFHPGSDSNMLYQHHNSSQPQRNVLLFGNAAAEKYINAAESEIGEKQSIIEYLERRLKDAVQMDKEDAEAEQNQVHPQLKEAREAIGALEKFYVDVSKDWREPENRILGHIVLSPPIGFSVGEEKFTEDWVVIEVNNSKVNATNFVGNVIDLGTTISFNEFNSWMYPHPANPPSFKYPGNRLLKYSGPIPDKEMFPEKEILKTSLKTLDHDNDPCIMVIKRGSASDLTVGRLNSTRSFTRVYVKGQPGQESKEVAVLPRNSKSGPFSKPGDSGSAVFDGKGRLAGLLTGGAGSTDVSDCTYLTSINFILKRMLKHGLKANLNPSLG